jgi:hypothetical protein
MPAQVPVITKRMRSNKAIWIKAVKHPNDIYGKISFQFRNEFSLFNISIHSKVYTIDKRNGIVSVERTATGKNSQSGALKMRMVTRA